MQFSFRHVNRLTYPTCHILVCEDNISNQSMIINHFSKLFHPEGDVQISVVPGSLAASAIIHFCKVDLILLDHDMPQGNGADLLDWMKKNNIQIPVITFSGIYQNNEIMMLLGAAHKFMKCEVLQGNADKIIVDLIQDSREKKEKTSEVVTQ